ncbi:MAG: hypothetical protein AB2L14_19435 [Candidatus Xenobiia bacterium LiM19]
MPQFGINFREFFGRYFADHDDTFLSNLGEMISEDADPREIAALADWHFRNYIIEAVTIAMQLNNEKIYNDVTALLEEKGYREPAQYRAPEEHESINRPFPSHMDGPSRPYQDLPVIGSTQGRRTDETSGFMGIGPQRGFESPPQMKGRLPEYDEAAKFNAIPEMRGLRDMRKMADSGGFSEPAEEAPRQSDDLNTEE